MIPLFIFAVTKPHLVVKNRICILILGMHRSGTSALSGSLERAGVYIGKSLVNPSHDNPKGFFENYKIQDLNDEILSLLDTSWDTVNLLPDKWRKKPEILKLELQARKIIKREYGQSELICIKDPRICLVFPFWKNVLDALDIKTVTIITLRPPTEIVASLSRRNQINEAKSYLMTATYLLSAEKLSRNTPRVIIRYEDLLERPIKVLKEMDAKIGLGLDLTDLTSDSINRFIKRDLKNHSSSASSILSGDQTTHQKPWIKHANSIYHLLNPSEEIEVKNMIFQLDNIGAAHASIVEENRANIENATYVAKLLIDNGGGFNEKEAIILPISGGKMSLVFPIGQYNKKPINKLKLFVSNTPCSIDLLQLNLNYSKEKVTYSLSDNSYHREGSLFYFENPFPQIIFELESPVSLKDLNVHIEYLSLGKKLNQVQSHKNTKKPNSKAWLLGPVKSIARHPMRFLKSINMKNYRTLRSALRRESPRTILRNIKKLLERPDVQKELQAKSTNEQSDFFRKKESIDQSYESRSKKNNIEKDRVTSASRLKVLYISPHLPEYDTSSGGKRATRLLTLLSEDCDVIVLSLMSSKLKYATNLENEGIEVIAVKEKGRLKKQHPLFDIIIFAWYYSFYDASWVKTAYPDSLLIIDTVDVHWVREERSIGIVPELTLEIVSRNKKKEKKAYDEADIIWVVSKPDRDAVKLELPTANVHIVSNIHEPLRKEYKDPGTNNLLFLGSYNHDPNISAVILLAEEIFPKVLKKVPDTQLMIAGADATKEIATLGDINGIRYLGFIEEENLGQLYDQTFLSVSPLLAGAGIKGKICEAISYSVPVVTNAIGNEGIGLVNGKSGLLSENVNEMADIIAKALLREYKFENITDEAQKVLKDIVGPEKVKERMISSLYRPVDICIVTYNRLDLLRECIKSIVNNTRHPNYNIIIYSNGCSDGTQEYLVQLQNENEKLIAILSKSNDVFVRPNNKMMALHPDHDVILLNNDTTVRLGWLKGLHHTAYKLKSIGIVGSKLLYPDGRLQEFGSELYEDGTGRNIGKWDEDPSRDEYNRIMATGYVSGCAMYIKRSTIKLVGAFDDQFHPCYCEDSDYCYTGWENGLWTVVTPYSIVYHHEGATSGKEQDTGYKKYQKINMEKFLSKHGKNTRSNEKEIKRINRQLKKILYKR